MNQANPPEQLQHRQVFRQEIRNRIQEAIFSGELKPGERIIETFWAKEIGVSQGPVREAIRDLEAMGLVETIPFKGSRVRTMTEKDIRDYYGTRICLESKSIQDAIHDLDDDQLGKLAESLHVILEQMDVCAEQGDLRAFSACDADFHKAIIDSTGNMVLFRLWEQCHLQNWFTFSALTDKKSMKQLQHQHQRLFNAICNRNAQEATAILDTHLTGLMKSFMFGEN